jgi:cytochrome oxidase Cu insertion factor (SCO1/SenC/PrrC family)
VLGTVPDFRLTERSGRVVTRDELRGKVWVADFFFTRCRGVCPLLTARLAELQRRIGLEGAPDVRFVSFTVDPAADTPEVLAAYAAQFGASPSHWLFLTGDRAALFQLIGQGFGLAVAERPQPAGEDPNERLTHSDRFALVDGRFRIRGFYRGTDADAVEELVRDLTRVRAAGD